MPFSPVPVSRRLLPGPFPPPPGGDSAAASGLLPAALLAAPVLVIEDEAVIAWMVEDILETMGFTAVTLVPSAEAAIEQAARQPPRLIVSDINLGVGARDGVDAVAAIVATQPAATVFITGYASAEARARIDAAAPGAAILRKPVSRQELQGAIERGLGRDRLN